MSQRERPSVDQQLAEANARPGSALEKLIRDNQDFDMLQPEEAQDDVGLPLWLRVYWRKTHPDVPHPKTNPGAGYPDVLHTIYQRMLSHPDEPWGTPGDPTQGGKQ